MKRVILLTAAAAAVLALGACSKGADKTAAAGGTTGAPAAETAATPAADNGPISPPSRKAGLWEQTISMTQMTQTTKMCLDEATEQKVKWWGGQAKAECSEQSFKRKLGGGMSFHSVCNAGEGATVTSDGEVTGDFGSHYKVDVTSTTTGSSMHEANGVHKITIDATWKGPCPAGMKGGDMEMPGGMRINILGDGPPAGAGGPHYGPGHMPSQAEIARMRAQAQEMAKAMKAQQQ